ncbi:hypothetical protein AB0A70_04200 [Streptomyces morookaense]|uniref:hypothetical protein n=1 Tax=Streptomyces morookaense TaxID=1970 RepID=UPI0033C0B961
MHDTDESLLRELAAIERLQTLASDSEATTEVRREYHLRRAVAVDQYAQQPAGTDFVDDAEKAARALLDFDRTFGTSRGPEPATDEKWDHDPRGYVRRQHVLEMHPEHRRSHA